MDMDTVHQIIEKERMAGVSYDAIGHQWGINGAMVQYIEAHKDYKPGYAIRQKLGIDPTRKQLADRARRRAQREELIRLRILVNSLRVALLCASVCNELQPRPIGDKGACWGVPSDFQTRINDLIELATPYKDCFESGDKITV
jgi:hypothetical protein